MNKILVLNSFSLNMLSERVLGLDCLVQIHPLSLSETQKIIAESGVESAVGHPDTAAIFSTLLGVEVPFNRATVALENATNVLVGQYRGPRLAEGVKILPEGSRIDWFLVKIG